MLKERIEEEILSLDFEKVVIARPSHLLGERLNERINLACIYF